MDSSSILPLFGFQADQTFASLLPHNHFLYVVYPSRYTPHLPGHGFLAQELRPSLSDDAVLDEALRRAALTRRSPSDAENIAVQRVLRAYCISASLSLPSAILRAEYAGVPAERVRIAVIRAASVGTALLGRELFSLADDLWDFEHDLQEVLVVGHISSSAIIADITLFDLMQVMPPWISHRSEYATVHQPSRPGSPQRIPPFAEFAREWAQRARKVRPTDAVAMAVRAASGILRSTRAPSNKVDYAAHQIRSDHAHLAAELLVWPERPELPLSTAEARSWHERRIAAEAATAAVFTGGSVVGSVVGSAVFLAL
jgi:hypothetical protein